MFEREFRDAAYVPRWAIMRTIRQQFIAEHAYFVAIYADQIARDLFPEWEPQNHVDLLRLALFHDIEEIISGDIANPAKKAMKRYAGAEWSKYEEWLDRRLDERFEKLHVWKAGHDHWHIRTILKIADLLEACVYLKEEMMLGNQNLKPCYNYLYDVLRKTVSHLGEASGIIEKSNDLMHEIKDALSLVGSTPSKLVTGDET